MPVRESEAIILRSFPLGEGDRLVSFLSRSAGRLRGVAAGARKPKSRFGSTLEPLSYIRIWFYERETRDLVRISQCDLIESFLDVQRDYTAGIALAVISEATELVLGEREAADPNFRLLLAVSRALKAGAEPQLALGYFALWTVLLGGWLPALDHCARCGKALMGNGYASRTQGVFCGDCRLPGQRMISAPGLQFARRMLGAKIDTLIAEKNPLSTIVEVMDYMLDLIEIHGEKQLQSRRMLAAELKQDPNREQQS